MANTIGPGAGLSASDYTKNAQQVGAQRLLMARNEVPGEKKDGPSDVVDHVEIAKQHGVEAGVQTGLAQYMGKKESGVETEGETPSTPYSATDPKLAAEKQMPQQVPLFMSDLYGQDPSKCGGCPGGTPPVPPPGGGPVGPGVPGGPGGPGVPGDPGGPVAPGGAGPIAPPSGNPTDSTNQSTAANMAQMAQNDAMQANEVYMQMAMARQKHMWKIFQMMQNLQTDIMQIISDAAAKRAATMDKIAAKWAKVLGGGGE